MGGVQLTLIMVRILEDCTVNEKAFRMVNSEMKENMVSLDRFPDKETPPKIKVSTMLAPWFCS